MNPKEALLSDLNVASRAGVHGPTGCFCVAKKLYYVWIMTINVLFSCGGISSMVSSSGSPSTFSFGRCRPSGCSVRLTPHLLLGPFFIDDLLVRFPQPYVSVVVPPHLGGQTALISHPTEGRFHQHPQKQDRILHFVCGNEIPSQWKHCPGIPCKVIFSKFHRKSMFLCVCLQWQDFPCSHPS